MKKISLFHLQMVNSIVKEGSLTKAANVLCLSQSALSHQLKDLETKVGLKIFNRVNRKLVLTETGGVVFNTSEKVLPSMNELEAYLKRIKDDGVHTIRVSTECYTCYHWLPKVVQAFHNEKKSINVQIVIEATKEPLKYLTEGKIDLAIVTRPTEQSSIVFQPLMEDEMVVVMSNHNDLSSCDSIELKQLNTQNLILYDIPEDKNFVLNSIFQKDRDIGHRIQKVQLTESIIELVSANLGVSVLAKWAVMPFLQEKGLSIRPLEGGKGARQWFLASLNEISPSEKEFTNKLKVVFDEKCQYG